MTFDISKVYTAVNADELKVGSKVIVADDFSSLKTRVSCEKDWVFTLKRIWGTSSRDRFEVQTGGRFNLCYLVSEPEEEKCERCINSGKEIDCNKCDIQNEKHYRPFKDCDELVETYNKRAFTPIVAEGMNSSRNKMFRPEIWVKSKAYGVDNLITAFDNDNESIGGSCVFVQDIWVDMQELLDCFTFCDGSPVGKLEE